MRLNLGAGAWQPDGYTGVDLEGAEVTADLAVTPWPFENESATDILASHVLEHFTRDDAWRFLGECYRILAPGGALWIAVPDLDKFIDCHLSGDFSPLGGYHWTSLDTLMGGGRFEPNPAQRHRYMWSEASLSWTLGVVGFKAQRVYHAHGPFNPRYEHISLYVRAQK